MKRILVDMSCTILHHGHIRLLKKASKLGIVIVGLTTDEEVFKKKGYWPEISFKYRKEILSSIVYVNDVIPSPWLITNSYIKKNKIDILVHGHDNSNKVTNCKIRIFQRTKGVSSTEIRKKAKF